VLYEICFLLFNNCLSVMPFFALIFVYTKLSSEFAGVWMVNIFRLQTRHARDFIFLAILDIHKQQVSFSYQRRTVGQKLDIATSLSLQRIFNK